MSSGYNILVGFKRKWQVLLWLETLLYGVGTSILIYTLFSKILLAVVVAILIVGVLLIFTKPWKPSLESAASYMDQHLDAIEYSTGLILIPENELSGLARIQQNRAGNILVEKYKTIQPPSHLKWSFLFFALCLGIGLILNTIGIFPFSQNPVSPLNVSDEIVFIATDSSIAITAPPKLIKQELEIKYPAYTRIKSVITSDMDIKVIEGTKVTWRLEFDKEIKEAFVESAGNSYVMKFTDGIYFGGSEMRSSGFYNFKFIDLDDKAHVSKLYPIEVTKDKSPETQILGIKQFTSFEYSEDKKLAFRTKITDDFGIGDAYIIATVSKGSGESVKFREEKLRFSNLQIGSKDLDLSKEIDLDKMKMEPGDELYFYVEATDQKRPQKNVSRSETYFAAIKDTISDTFAVEGTMGVDLMPDYFRSQRQLIIDTEKLLKDKSKLSAKEYKSRSNELGFDQKVLRIKYAEFMGDETEEVHAAEGDGDDHDHEEEHDHDHDEHEDHEEEDPLAKYTHKHDHENEHNLVPEEEKKEKDPLEEYLHNHDDPEESTLFTQSLKSKLRQALNEMWDAELYLRLYKPEKSLPYQYRALKLIQEIKNSARIYVHRIGFDPPPIKEEKRLTGEIDKVHGFRKIADITEVDTYKSIRLTLNRLQTLITAREKEEIAETDKQLFREAANELAIKAIEKPGKYLTTLQQLKWISEDVEIPYEALIELQQGLLQALPAMPPNAFKKEQPLSEINELLLKELEINE
ncbi:tryptophan-rich sensory protein [uncultured Aquimarina sp.]|uniref:tryptophan-rich sensory protein n=1 Tax=uncultured Aquimarina sp. TaxID=575652 RepID=UPI00262A383F|nr:tryptophan-rich sensory protein [uncultured Aquimarina sp.]